MLRSKWKVFLLIAAVASVFYWRPVWSGEYTILSGFENTNQAYAWYHFVASSLKQGIIPGWDPYTFAGRSFPGEMQTGAFYPLNLLIAALPFNRAGYFSPHIYNYMFLLSHILGAFFMFLLMRQLKRSNFASLISGFCFSFAGVVQSMTSWPDRYQSVIWLPLGLLFAVRALEAAGNRLRYLYAALCGIALGLPILAGGLHIVIMQMIILVTSVAAYAIFQRKDVERAEWLERCKIAAAILGVALAFAAATGAAQLLSSVEYSSRAIRWVVAGAMPAGEKIPYQRLNEGLLPNALTVMLFGSPASNIVDGEFTNPYLGVLTLGFALIGIWRAWWSRWVKYLTSVAILAFAYALGAYSFLHGALYLLVPRMWMAREANRFMYMADFALTAIAAFGIDALLDSSSAEFAKPLRRALKWVGGAAALALCLPALYSQAAMSPWVYFSLLMIVASCGIIAYVLRGSTGTVAKIAIALLALSDMYAFDWGARSIKVEQSRNQDQLQRLYSAKPAMDFVKAQPGMYRLGVTLDLPPSFGLFYGIATNSGTGATMQADFDRIRHRDNLFNVKYMLKATSDPQPNPVYQDKYWKVYALDEPCPRAWLVHQVERRSSQKETVERLDNSDFNPLKTAVLTGGVNAAIDPIAPGAAERVNITNYEPQRIRVRVSSSGRGLLVLSENYFPGWKATVNGTGAEVLRVDSGLRGVVVPGGESTVELHYAPVYMTVGLPLTCLTMLFGLVAPLLYWFRYARPARGKFEATA